MPLVARLSIASCHLQGWPYLSKCSLQSLIERWPHMHTRSNSNHTSFGVVFLWSLWPDTSLILLKKKEKKKEDNWETALTVHNYGLLQTVKANLYQRSLVSLGYCQWTCVSLGDLVWSASTPLFVCFFSTNGTTATLLAAMANLRGYSSSTGCNWTWRTWRCLEFLATKRLWKHLSFV